MFVPLLPHLGSCLLGRLALRVGGLFPCLGFLWFRLLRSVLRGICLLLLRLFVVGLVFVRRGVIRLLGLAGSFLLVLVVVVLLLVLESFLLFLPSPLRRLPSVLRLHIFVFFVPILGLRLLLQLRRFLLFRFRTQLGLRRPLLVLGYLVGLSSPIVLLVSSALWHFWIAVVLHYVSLGIINAVAPALVADVVPAETLGRAMSLFSATLWIGGIIGFAGTGYAIQRLGLDLTFVLGACLSLVATVLVAVLPRTAPPSTRG